MARHRFDKLALPPPKPQGLEFPPNADTGTRLGTPRGTEKRALYEDSYNVFFRQPRFFFDNFGTEEFVVYNKQDEHIMLSHTSWILIFTPEEMRKTQGWYEVHDAPSPHWKYFWFD